MLVQKPTIELRGLSLSCYGSQAGRPIAIANGNGRRRDIGHGGGPYTLRNPGYDFNDITSLKTGTPARTAIWPWLAQTHGRRQGHLVAEHHESGARNSQVATARSAISSETPLIAPGDLLPPYTRARTQFLEGRRHGSPLPHRNRTAIL